MSKPAPRAIVISQLFDAVYPSFAMLAGMELDLFTQLEAGPVTVEQLADTIGIEATKLRPLLYALVVAGLLTIEEGLFSNTLETNYYLVRDRPGYLGEMQELTANNWSRTLRTAETIRSGRPPIEYDYHSDTQDELAALLRGLIPGVRRDARRLIEQYDFTAHRTLLDVGGGSGALAIALVQANPNLQATVVDLPSVTPITQQFVDEAKIADRVEIQTADLVREPLPQPYDAIVARHLIQVLSEDESRALLGNVVDALNPGGVLHLIGWVLDNSRLSPEKIVGYNLILLNGYPNGQAYTEFEYRDWLDQAGLVDFERVVKSDGSSFISARKPF